MRYRPVDEDGDMMPIPRISYMLEGADAVGAAVNSRVKMIKGQWWQDKNAGFAVPKYILSNTRLGSYKDLICAYIENYIRSTQGVQSLFDSKFEYDGRDMKYNCKVVTVYSSEFMKTEVTGDVIRGSIS